MHQPEGNPLAFWGRWVISLISAISSPTLRNFFLHYETSSVTLFQRIGLLPLLHLVSLSRNLGKIAFQISSIVSWMTSKSITLESDALALHKHCLRSYPLSDYIDWRMFFLLSSMQRRTSNLPSERHLSICSFTCLQHLETDFNHISCKLSLRSSLVSPMMSMPFVKVVYLKNTI